MQGVTNRVRYESIKLLLQVLPILTRSIILAAERELDIDARTSYRRLQAWFMLLHSEMNRTKDFIVLAEEQFNLLLDRLGSLVVASMIKPSSSGRQKLRSLWHQKRHSTATETHQWLNLSCLESNENLEAIIRQIYDFSRMQYPYGVSLYRDDPPMERRKRASPPLDVCEAAQNVYEALESAQECTCNPAHSFDARLLLATHRNPNSETGKFEFEMLLSLEREWQEVAVGTKADGAFKFVINDDSGEVATSESKKLIQNLCKPLSQIRNQLRWRSTCLQFDVDEGFLWNKPPKASLSPLVFVEKSVSLEEFIMSGKSFTEMTKRVLAVLLGHTVLHLHGTQWMDQDWGASQVIFLQTASAVPLAPYIQIHLTTAKPGPLVDCSAETNHDSDDENFFSDPDVHPLPHFVSLGMMLMQIYLGKTYQSIAEECGIVDSEFLDEKRRFALASQAFEKYSYPIGFSPEYFDAIDRCLDPHIQDDECGRPMTTDAFRKVVYDDIIRRLEDELYKTTFFSNNMIQNLDSEARKLDLANLGQPIEIQVQKPRGQPGLTDLRQQPSPRPLRTSLPSSLATTINKRTSLGSCHTAGLRNPIVYDESRPMCQYARRALAFFDDESKVEDISQKAKDAFVSWKESILDVYDRFLVGDGIQKHTAIAVLDTGMDMDHPDLASNTERKNRINGGRNFLSSATPYETQDVHDNNGHGTHVTGLILDFAPDAQVYIAKIADHEPSPCHLVAEAIRHAVTSWQVDIISMSFGFNSRQIQDYDLVEQAIDYARSKNVLIFAAASNSGANQPRTFPARHDSVIAIHSTSGDGRPSCFNPPREETDNFATIGEAVESTWPVRLCDRDSNESCVAWKSGTSFATPIAAGIAAFLLEYVKANLDSKCVALLRRPQGMRAILREISRKCQGLDYVTLKFHPDHLFGKDPVYINQRLVDVLQTA